MNRDDKILLLKTIAVIIYLTKAFSLPSILLINGLEKKDAGYIIAVIEAAIVGIVSIVVLNLVAGDL
jgi:hypothetical protein